nr:phosphatidate cytidylyltransferase [Armatimonadota bacterium]NIO97641.1 phosphatidate cytidylyltransferase [Armatimonadota bacterium]
AFLCGRFIGGPKLCKSISPGKTVAGFFGAIITAALAVWAGFALVGLSAGHGLLLGALMGVTGQLGDLGKSLIKRETGIKDFGLVFPGHGGVLDRFDNVLFDAPLMFYYLKWLLMS